MLVDLRSIFIFGFDYFYDLLYSLESLDFHKIKPLSLYRLVHHSLDLSQLKKIVY